MFCPYCGTNVTGDALFCPECGGKLDIENNACAAPAASNANVTASPAEKKKTPKEVTVPESVKETYAEITSLPAAKRKKVISQLRTAEAKYRDRSAGAMVKKIAIKVVAVILVFLLTSSTLVTAFAYFKGTDTPEPISTVLTAAKIIKDEDDQSEEEETSSEEEQSDDTENEAPADESDEDDTDVPDNTDDPLTPENKKMIEEYSAECESISDTITDELDLVGQEVINEDGDMEIIYETKMDAAKAVAEELYNNDEIDDYSIGTDNILFTLKDGKKFMYLFAIDGCSAGGNTAHIDIATYEPCRTGDLGAATGDDGAKAITGEFPNYRFIHNYDDTQADLSVFEHFGDNQIICWSGHGGFNSTIGSHIATGTTVSNIPNRYTQYVNNGTVFDVWTEKKIHYAGVSIEFLRQVIPDDSLNGSIIFLGTCDSCMDNRLANLLREKGALAVLGYSNTVHTSYDKKMTKAFFTRLATAKADGTHYSLQESLDYAKDQHGRYDHHDESEYFLFFKLNDKQFDTELVMHTDEPGFTLDQAPDPGSDRNIVLVLDVSGSMSGTPLAETKQAAQKFIQTVKDSKKDVGIALVTFSDRAKIVCNFSKNYEFLSSCINSVNSGGDTNFVDALSKAENLMSVLDTHKNSIVFMTDGEPNEGGGENDILNISDRIKSDLDQHIYTLGFFSNSSNYTHAKALLDKIASDGCHYEVNDVEQIKFFFEDMASEISGSTQYINIIIACPVDVTVKYKGEKLTSKGVTESTRTDFGSITFQGEITEGESDDRTKILRLKADNKYDISIDGNGNGTMDYTIQFMDENGDYTDVREFKDVKIRKRTKINAIAEKSEESVLEVDEDGDGKTDYKYTAKTNSEGVLRDYREFKIILLSCAIFTVVLRLVLDIVSVVKAKKRKALLKLIDENKTTGTRGGKRPALT